MKDSQEATPRQSAELTVTQAIKRAKEWQESDELMIAPEIVTALLEAAEGFDTQAARVAELTEIHACEKCDLCEDHHAGTGE